MTDAAATGAPAGASAWADTQSGASSWADALTTLALFSLDPASFGGIRLRAGAGPVRDRWLDLMRDALPATMPWRRMPTGIGDERLLGGIDLAATLQAGRPIAQRGLLAEADGGIVVLPMAERLPPGTAARLGAALDTRDCAGIALVALDEAASDDEHLAPGLIDRMAFQVDLEAVSLRDAAAYTADDPGDDAAAPGANRQAAAAILAAGIAMPDDLVEALCTTAAALGIASLRAPLLAVQVARAAAALAGRSRVDPEDAALAGRLVLAPRATRLPQPPDPPPESESNPEPESQPDQPPETSQGDAPSDQPDSDTTRDTGPETTQGDMLLQAAAAAIPAGLLAQIRQREKATGRSPEAGRAGAVQKGGARGRAAGIRSAPPGPGLRLNLIETLRAAAPWQTIRQPVPSRDPSPPGTAPEQRIRIRRDDFRVTRFEQRARTTTIFVVDASGSSALNRLAEAKGAVELLLADCYTRRDQVAVLAFRGRLAQLLLPPTRSLVRAKRSLATLPGGGGTPLAAGIEAGLKLALAIRRSGATPSLVLLTDGRGNVARNGAGGRALAQQEAQDVAKAVRAQRIATLLVDTSPRPAAEASRLAGMMGALYLPLPYADAAALSRGVRRSQAARL